jgi:hypothetical protein
MERYRIGTITNGIFEPDTLGNDPELTSFDTIALARDEMHEIIRASRKMWGEPLTNGAIQDSATGRIVWRQESE